MGEGKEVKTRESAHVEVQERGEIFFFYRPRVNKDSAHSIGDVQRMYIILRPESGEREVEEKQSSQSGKEGSFNQTKAEETNADNAGEQSTKQSAKSADSSEPDGEQRGPEFKAEAEENAEAPGGHRSVGGKDENVRSPKKEEEADLENSERKVEKQTQEADNAGDERISGKEAGKGSAPEDRAPKEEKQNADEERVAGKGSETVDIAKQTLYRFIVMGRKSLPDASKRTRPYWGFVELVTTDVQDIKKALSAETYETKTRGQREKPACRPVGEGIYRLIRHMEGKRVHTHLVYKLELPGPDKQHEPQEALNIEREGSYIIQIKNPEQGNPPSQGLQNKRKSTYPAHLQGRLGSYRFVPADPPDFLNYEGCEFILISASDDIEGELGLDLEVEHLGNTDSSDLLNLFGGSNKETEGLIKPLIEGEWA